MPPDNTAFTQGLGFSFPNNIYDAADASRCAILMRPRNVYTAIRATPFPQQAMMADFRRCRSLLLQRCGYWLRKRYLFHAANARPYWSIPRLLRRADMDTRAALMPTRFSI